MKNQNAVERFKEGMADVRADFAAMRAANKEARENPNYSRRRLTRIGGAIMAIAGAYYASRQGVDSKTLQSTVEQVVGPTAQAAKFAWGAGRFETQFRARKLAPLSAELTLKPGEREMKRRRRAAAVMLAATSAIHPVATAAPAAAEVKPVVQQAEAAQPTGQQVKDQESETPTQTHVFKIAKSGDSVEGWAAQLVDDANGPGPEKPTDWQVHKVADSIVDANPAIENDPQHWMQEGDNYDVTEAQKIAEDVSKHPK